MGQFRFPFALSQFRNFATSFYSLSFIIISFIIVLSKFLTFVESK